jgi:hypothetical protein
MRYCFLWRARGQWSRRHSVYSSPGGNRHVGDTASFAAPDGNGHIDVSGMSRGVRYSGQAYRISAYYDLLVAAISTVPVIATRILAWAVRTRWAETQGHPATGTARTEAMHWT